MPNLEETNKLALDFDKLFNIAKNTARVIPVAVQDADTSEVILIAYTNELAFKKTMKTGNLVLWSTSRNELWEKGKTSGNTFKVVDAFVNCEQNSLLYRVRPVKRGICHTYNKNKEPRNCYYRKINPCGLTLTNINP